ncbi:MAG: hypothetical protein EBU67_10910 [Actinobacteria bacterium]|nr:hypothetical protein [Actinomycetota bacterium]
MPETSKAGRKVRPKPTQRPNGAAIPGVIARRNPQARGQLSFPNCGVPPFGHSTQLRVFVDPDLLQCDEVWAAAGTWNDNFGANPNDIVRVAGGVVTDLKRA